MTSKQQFEMKQENVMLHQENEELKAAQTAFFKAMESEIQAIENSPKIWRWFRYGALLFQLIGTIKSFIQEAKEKKTQAILKKFSEIGD